MKRNLIFTLILFFIVLNFISCSKEESLPEGQQSFSEILQDILTSKLEQYGGKGVSAAVLIPGRNDWLGVGGVSYGTTAISSGMIFSIGGITTNFIAALVLQLREEGLLTLEDPLHKWLEDYPNIDNTITIRQLLNQTSGVFEFNNHPAFYDSLAADNTRRWTPEETIVAFTQEQFFPPGTRFQYSNTNYILLGMVIKAVTGTEVSSEIRHRFLEPLGLTNTYFAVEEELAGEIAHGWHDMSPEDYVLDDITSLSNTAYYSINWTSGAMFSSAEDIASWNRELLGGNVLSQSSLNQMISFNPINIASHPGWGYGFGITSYGSGYLDGIESIGQGGGSPGYCAKMVYLTDYGIYITVMMNERQEDCLNDIVKALSHEAVNHIE